MKEYIFALSLILFMLQVGYEPRASADETRVFRVGDRKIISYGQMIDDIKRVDLVFVGETHDNELHHRLQLDILKSLHTSNSPVAAGFEMFTAESQNDLDRWTAGLIPSESFTTIYYRNWNFPWPLYRDIFLYVKDNKIPAIGLNVPADISQKVAKSGFSALTKEQREKLPPETGCAVDEKYMKFIRKAYAMHGHGGRQFLYFCEAQLLWDQVMAWNLIEFLKKDSHRTVVVLTGNGHAWKRGIPEQVHNSSGKISYRVILPEVRGSIEPSNITIEDADYILLK